MRPWRLIPLGLLAAALAAILVYWPWIDAQRRAVIVLSTTMHTPVLTWLVKVATDEPKVEETIVAGNPTTLARPGGGGPWPGVVFVNGATEDGRFQKDVQRLARGLARAGYLVLVPDLPGLAQGEITDATVKATVGVALEAARRPDVRDGRIGLVGVSVGTTLALLAAEDPVLAPRVTAVAGFAPYVALPNVIRLATTGFHLDEGKLKPYDADPFVALVVARSLVAGLPLGSDRARLLAGLRAVDEDAPDPLSGLRRFPASSLGPAAAAVVRLLANRHPTIFDGLYAALPADLRAGIERLSPLIGAAQLRARVELASAPHDKYFPIAESRALARASPHVHVTVTGALGGHVVPEPSFSDVGGLFRFDGFVVRALKALRG